MYGHWISLTVPAGATLFTKVVLSIVAFPSPPVEPCAVTPYLRCIEELVEHTSVLHLIKAPTYHKIFIVRKSTVGDYCCGPFTDVDCYPLAIRYSIVDETCVV